MPRANAPVLSTNTTAAAGTNNVANMKANSIRKLDSEATLKSNSNASIEVDPELTTPTAANGRLVEGRDLTDYLTCVKNDGQTWTVTGLDICQQLHRETDNRNPTFYKLKPSLHAQFNRNAEREVIENQLRVISKYFKQAIKKKSPQSAMRPVYANLEGLTLFLQSKDAWYNIDFSNEAEVKKLAALFHAFGCVWVHSAAKLESLGSFSENVYPSVRTAVHAANAVGALVNEKAGKSLSDWPDKLEAIWTGSVFAGDVKPKSTEEDGGKKQKKKSKNSAAEEEKKVAKLSASKIAKLANAHLVPEMWDFKEAMTVLKGDRKQVGGVAYDLSLLTSEQRANFAKTGVVVNAN